jgi:hypothetical protein
MFASRTARLARVLAVAGLSLGAGLPALAQSGSGSGSGQTAQPRQDRPQRGGGGGGMFGGMGGMFGGMGRGAGVSQADLDRIGAMVGMDKAQLEAAGMLREAYVAELEAYGQQVREKMDDLRREAREAGGADPSIWRDMGEEMRKAQARRQEMEAKLLTDMQDLLTPQQAEKWPAVERMRTRERSIGMGMMSGERVDVIRQVEQLELDEKAAKELAPVLEQYSIDLDRELKARNALFEANQGQIQEIFTSGDTAKATKLIEDARAAAVKVRDVNRRYARQIENMLPEAKRAEFATAVKRESFPAIYRTGRAGRTLERAAALDDLTAEQKTSIAQVMESHTREMASIQSQMERAYEQRETSIKADEVVGMFMGGMGGGGRRGMGGLMDTPELEDLRTRRRDLETASLDKVRALLTDAQKERLDNRDDAERASPNAGGQGDEPQPRRRGNRGGDRGGDRGNDRGNDRGTDRPANQQS